MAHRVMIAAQSAADARNHFTVNLDDIVIFRRDSEELVAESSRLSRAVVRGHLVRLKRGAYVRAGTWTAMKPEEKHLARVFAYSRSHPGAVFSHVSAALLHALPLVGSLPDRVQVLDQRASGGRSEPGLQRRCLGFREDEVVQDAESGIRFTGLSRTLADLAHVQPFAYAVAPLDHALRSRLVSSDQVLEAMTSRMPFAGSGRVLRALQFGDGRAQRAGESVSRAVIHELGFAPPELQTRHEDPRGGFFFTDFEWPDVRQIGEFDGKGKYLREEWMGGRTAGEVVYDEKRREDYLRAEGSGVTRWGWSEALAREPLRRLLLTAGVPVVRRVLRPRGRW